MCTKSERQQAISNMLRNNTVNNHETLQALLAGINVKVTQATLSRDLNEMGVIKTKNAKGEYCYRLREDHTPTPVPSDPHFAKSGILSLEFNQSIAVIRTYPGMASAVSVIIDSNVKKEVMGSIAGDDTILLIIREKYTQKDLTDALAQIFPDIENKII